MRVCKLLFHMDLPGNVHTCFVPIRAISYYSNYHEGVELHSEQASSNL